MKLYYFYPESYGDEYFVVSDSIENAQKKVREYLREEKEYLDSNRIDEILKRFRVIEPNIVLRSELA